MLSISKRGDVYLCTFLIQRARAEKNKLQALRVDLIKGSCQLMIKVISEQIEFIVCQISSMIKENSLLTAKKSS